MIEKFSVDNLQQFVSEFASGSLKPYIKSEPIPEDNTGPVKVVVGENFNSIVKDPTKDVLIEFYVSGFPTMYWAPMGNKENPVKYQGGRELNDFVEYIKKQATNPVDLPEKTKKKKK